ncbi:Sorting nexin-27 [Apis mellifera caucasica]|nr:Sorting nexin-27 [Apis mellifera caucasica]
MQEFLADRLEEDGDQGPAVDLKVLLPDREVVTVTVAKAASYLKLARELSGYGDIVFPHCACDSRKEGHVVPAVGAPAFKLHAAKEDGTLESQVVEFQWNTITRWEVDEEGMAFCFQYTRQDNRPPRWLKLFTPYKVLLSIVDPWDVSVASVDPVGLAERRGVSLSILVPQEEGNTGQEPSTPGRTVKIPSPWYKPAYNNAADRFPTTSGQIFETGPSSSTWVDPWHCSSR